MVPILYLTKRMTCLKFGTFYSQFHTFRVTPTSLTLVVIVLRKKLNVLKSDTKSAIGSPLCFTFEPHGGGEALWSSCQRYLDHKHVKQVKLQTTSGSFN